MNDSNNKDSLFDFYDVEDSNNQNNLSNNNSVSQPVNQVVEEPTPVQSSENQTNNITQPTNQIVPEIKQEPTSDNIEANEEQTNNIPQPQIEIVEDKKNEIDNEELVKAYIGDKYDSFVSSKFNVGAFFFTALYLFYRKMYMYGILCFIITIFIGSMNNIIGFAIVINIALAFTINNIYLSFVKLKVANIKSNYKGASLEELKSICQKQGGTSIPAIFIGFISEMIVLLIISMLLVLLSMFGIVSRFSAPSGSTSPTNGKFTGKLNYAKSINIQDEFYIKVPDEFKMKDSSSTYNYVYQDKTCDFKLGLLEEYNDAEDLINQIGSNHVTSKYSNSSVNQKTWYIVNYSDDTGNKYYYATNKDGKVYLYEFNIKEKANANCEKYREEIFQTIKSK